MKSVKKYMSLYFLYCVLCFKNSDIFFKSHILYDKYMRFEKDEEC